MTHQIAMKMYGVRMALATGEILDCLSSPLINKEAEDWKYDKSSTSYMPSRATSGIPMQPRIGVPCHL